MSNLLPSRRSLRLDRIDRRATCPLDEKKPHRRGHDADPGNDGGALAPDQEGLTDQERSGDMPDALEEAIGCGHRIDTDLRCQLGMRNVRDNRGIDEAVRDSDDDHARYHQDDVGSRSTENRHAGQTDQDQSKPADRRTPEEDRVRLAGAIDQTGDVAARSNDTDAVEHDDLTDLLLLEALPSEKQRQREGDDAGQYGFRRDAT